MKSFFLTLGFFLTIHSFSQNSIKYNTNNIEGVIFTKQYFKDNKQNFTPSLNDINALENKIRKSSEDFSNYYRQYTGVNDGKVKEIIIQLIPKNRVNLYKDWHKNFIHTEDDIEVRYIYYELKTKKLNIKPKDKISG